MLTQGKYCNCPNLACPIISTKQDLLKKPLSQKLHLTQVIQAYAHQNLPNAGVERLCPFPCGFEYRDKDGVDLCKGLQYEFLYAPVI